jgi:LCP family protein required for cell wall assembly
VYSLSCLAAALALVVSGTSYSVVKAVHSIGASHAIKSGPSIGAQNILLMGLESRTDWNGNILPADILNALHAGSAQGVANGVGGNATNTLILIHIPAGGKKAVGFSIPRDDWVTFAGTVGPQQQGKIDQAYGVSLYYEEAKLRAANPSMSQDQLAFAGNEAGRTAEVDTVEKLTGVHIDHFAEVNLDGFYELAKVLGGVNVCLNHAVRDANSGANFRAGRQHLNAAQALAFVRQRDGLPNGDLDRTHRQQAFLDAVMQQLRDQGVLGDLTRLESLLSVAKQYVITDSGWNLLDFGTQMRDLTSGNLVFHTLPIEGYATYYIGGASEDVNVINTAYIAAIVQATFYPKPTSPHAQATPSVTGSSTASPTASASSTASSSPTPSSVTIPTTGAQGGAVGAGNGIPCVN